MTVFFRLPQSWVDTVGLDIVGFFARTCPYACCYRNSWCSLSPLIVPGALFALEVLHTMGMQFFDVAVYAIGAGGVCLAVYRGLQGDDFGAIWSFPDAPQSSATEVILGAIVGAIAGGVGIAFRR